MSSMTRVARQCVPREARALRQRSAPATEPKCRWTGRLVRIPGTPAGECVSRCDDNRTMRGYRQPHLQRAVTRTPRFRVAALPGHWIENHRRRRAVVQWNPSADIGIAAIGDEVIPAFVIAAAGDLQAQVDDRLA